MAQVFVNPLEDSGFKILFRKKRNIVGFLEAVLDRFSKTESECESILEQYAYSLKNMVNEEVVPDSFLSEPIMNLYDDAHAAV